MGQDLFEAWLKASEADSANSDEEKEDRKSGDICGVQPEQARPRGLPPQPASRRGTCFCRERRRGGLQKRQARVKRLWLVVCLTALAAPSAFAASCLTASSTTVAADPVYNEQYTVEDYAPRTGIDAEGQVFSVENRAENGDKPLEVRDNGSGLCFSGGRYDIASTECGDSVRYFHNSKMEQ